MSERAQPSLSGAPPATPLEQGVDAEEVAETIEERFDLEGRTLREHTARGVIINAAFQIGLAVLNLVKRVGIAAFLTATEFGIWGLMLTTLLAVGWLKQTGISDKYIQQSERDQELAFQKAFTLELLYSLLFYGIALIALPLYALVVYDRPEILVPGFILSLALLGSAWHTPIWVYYRRMQFVRQRVLESVDPAISAVATFALAMAGLGYWALVLGVVAGTLAGSVAAVATSVYPIRFRYDSGTLREYYRFSWPLIFSGASMLVAIQGAVIIGNWELGLAAVGAIGLATSFSQFVKRVHQIINRTMYPAVCAITDRTQVMFESFVKSNRLGLMWGWPLGVGVALFASDFVEYVLGAKWANSDVALVLATAGLLLGIRQIAFNWQIYMRATNWTKPIAADGLLTMVNFLVITAPLMIVLGMPGYIIGVSCDAVFSVILRAWFMTRMFEGFKPIRHSMRAIAPSVPGVAAVLAVRALVPEGSPETALAELGLYVAITAVATWIFERSLLTEVFDYLRRKTRPTARVPTAEQEALAG